MYPMGRYLREKIGEELGLDAEQKRSFTFETIKAICERSQGMSASEEAVVRKSRLVAFEGKQFVKRRFLRSGRSIR